MKEMNRNNTPNGQFCESHHPLVLRHLLLAILYPDSCLSSLFSSSRVRKHESIGAGAASMRNSSSSGFASALPIQDHRHISLRHRSSSSLKGKNDDDGSAPHTLVKIRDLPTSAAQDSGTFIPPSHYILKLDASKGVGLVLSIVGSSIRVTGFAEKEGGGAGPAEMSGVVAVGDELLALNGKDLFCLKFDDIVTELTGLLGTREGDVEMRFAYGHTGGGGDYRDTAAAAPYPSSSTASLNGAERYSKGATATSREESDNSLVFGLTPPLQPEKKKQQFAALETGESLKDSSQKAAASTSVSGSNTLDGRIEGSSSVPPKFERRKNGWKLTNEEQWTVESSEPAVTFDTPQCVAQNRLESIAHELQLVPSCVSIDRQDKPTQDGGLGVKQQHAEQRSEIKRFKHSFQMFKPPPLGQDSMSIRMAKGWGKGSSAGLFQSQNYIVSTSHSSSDSLPYWYLELLYPSSREGGKDMQSAISNMPFLENSRCQEHDAVEAPLPSADLSLDSVVLFQMLEEAGVYSDKNYASGDAFKVVCENFLAHGDAESAIDVLLCIVNEIVGEQVKRDVQGTAGLKRDPLGLGVEKLLEGRLKSWPPENLTLAIGAVLLPKCHEPSSSAAAIPLLAKGMPLLQAWLQTFAPVPFAQRNSLWERLRDTPRAEQELRNANLTIRLATAYFLLHVAWPWLTLYRNADIEAADGKFFGFNAFDFDVSFAPTEETSDMHLPIWSEEEAEDYLDSYGAYLDLGTLAKAAGE